MIRRRVEFMERLRSPLVMESLGYVSWEEVKNDRGKREILYYLKRMDGGLDLAVIGKEKSLKHISYHYVVRNTSPLFSMVPSSRPKSRREVIDWLNSIVSDSLSESSHLAGSLYNSDSSELDIGKFKDTQLQKLRDHTKEFLWLGSPWTCRKRRKHYQSFSRNGVKISVCDFVHVLAEEDKRLVAYLEDMYEDSKGNKMVLVRWFHKIDEVGIALPHKFIDREIFFSLCLQDLSIECIDGTASVLSPLHFEKFLKDGRHTVLNPFVCYKLFENEEARPFDITQVKGYWKQAILRFINMASPEMGQANNQQLVDGLKLEADVNDGIRPRKRHCPSKNVDNHIGDKESMDRTMVDMHNVQDILTEFRSGSEIYSSVGGDFAALVPRTETTQNLSEHLKVGLEVEVLSQDSGIRGCWFRALIIKTCKNKVKVRYQDIKDADNESNNLEEWILATRIAVPDQLRIRISGRAMIRPHQKSNKGLVSWVLDVGASVDVWRNDVWQEGIVVQKESDDRFHVYFPGEKQDSVFCRAQLRHSQEWLGNGWIQIRERPDIVATLSSFFHHKQDVKTDLNKSVQTAINNSKQSEKTKVGSSDRLSDSGSGKGSNLEVVCDISKDDTLAQLRWNSSKKRRRSSGSGGQRMHHKTSGSKSWKEVIGSSGCESLRLLTNLKVDHDNCKYMGDSLFGSTAQPLTSLVMSR
ncbi:uncharacterized protein [Euphorbia lathyris]|uniref:uncharacterized protein n=1 Tax=Euphorbia lathyris TaxID=212925 RepID=UPI003313D479